MFPIPGIIISILTFPGVIVHELAHQLFCRWCRVAVFKVVYFQVANPVGYVIHERPRYKWQSILISVGPFFVNSIAGALIAMPGIVSIFQFKEGNFFDYLFVYLGVSIGMHAFPSTGDAKSMWNAVSESSTSWWLKAITIPVIGIIYLGAIGSFFWLDLAYGIGIGFGLPNLIVDLIA